MRDIDGPPHSLSTSTELKSHQDPATVERTVIKSRASRAAEHDLLLAQRQK
jgi:hypothetical protein